MTIDPVTVREFLTEWRKGLETSGANHSHEILDDLEETLFGPTLPTLADMTPEERDAQKWMQAQVFPTASALGIITGVDEYARSAIILFADGMAKNVPWDHVTPLPDLPKLGWPGSHADTITAESVEDMQAGRVADFEPDLTPLCPEDVPEGEAWLIKFNGKEMKAIKTGHAHCPWSVSDKTYGRGGRTAYSNRGVTLVSRLVPEVNP